MNVYDLLAAGYTPAGFRVRLDKPINAKLAAAIDHDINHGDEGPALTCCDVVGSVR